MTEQCTRQCCNDWQQFERLGMTVKLCRRDIHLWWRYTWYPKRDANGTCYAATTARAPESAPNSGHIVMHRLIVQGSPYAHTDHINRDGCDNRRCKLRLTDASTQRRNRRVALNKKSSKYHGVHRHGDKWIAQITIDEVKYRLGAFDTEEQARDARLRADRNPTLIKEAYNGSRSATDGGS